MKGKLTEKQKLAKSLYRELEELWKRQRALGMYKLPVPIQKGWTLQFRVREDVLRSSDGERYKLILPFVQNRRNSRTTEFTPMRDGTVLRLQTIREERIKNLGFPEFFWTKYFVKGLDYHAGYRTGVEFKYPTVYHIGRPHVFETEVVPNFIKQVPIIDPSLQSREKEIQNKIASNNLQPLINKIKGFHGCRCEYCINEEFERELVRQFELETRQEVESI